MQIDSEEEKWRVERLGNVTGSTFGKFVKKGKDGNYVLSTGKVAQDLMYKIAWERLLKEGSVSSEGLGRLSFSSKATDHGLQFENEAIELYEKMTFQNVESAQKFIKSSEWIGGTPDGFVGKEGLIEVKAPFNGGNHLKTLLTGEIYNQDYVYQIQGYLMITGRKWCDFITYDPDLIDTLQLSVTRIQRDEDVIKGIQMVLDQVVSQIHSIVQQTKSKI